MNQLYQPNVENMKEYLANENAKSKGGGPVWWSIPSGMSAIRIMPPWDPTGRVSLPVYMHPIEYKSADMAYTKYNWTCVNKTFNKPCSICQGLEQLASAGVDISEWEANRRQYYFNVLVMHDPSPNNPIATGTLAVMRGPKTFYDWVISQITNPMIGDITSVSNGVDVYITKEGVGLSTTYSMTLSPNGRTPVPQEYLDKIDDLYNLDEIFAAGFEQKQVDELVSHLGQSAHSLNQHLGNTVSQMAGGPITQMNQVPQMNPMSQVPQMNPMNPVPQMNPMNPVPQMNQPVGQVPQMNQPVGQVPQMQVAPNNGNAVPKCYGNYDVGSATCVVCPHEIPCSQLAGGQK